MYTRRSKCKNLNWNSIFCRAQYPDSSKLCQCSFNKQVSPYNNNKPWYSSNAVRNFCSAVLSFPNLASQCKISRACGGYSTELPFSLSRSYCSEGDESSASGGKHVSMKDSKTGVNEAKLQNENVKIESRRCNGHGWLGEQDQKEWFSSEQLSFDRQKMESPFLTKRERFRNEFLRRVTPWEKITVSWDTFPYYVNKQTKNMLVECATSHLKQKLFASSYGARLNTSSGRILLQGIPGTELYRERMVKALAHDLQVPVLVLDSGVHAPHGFSRECASESELFDEDIDSEEECSSYSEVEEMSNDEHEEVKSDESEEDNVDARASAAVLNKLVPCIDEFAKRVSGEVESETTSAAPTSDAPNSEQKSDRPFRRGDRVKYIGPSAKVVVDNRILLGKIATPDGPTNAYSFLSGRPLSSGQRGEVYEVNGDQVAIILDNNENKSHEDGKEAKSIEHDTKPSVIWLNIQDVAHDGDVEAQDWYIAVEALCEVLPSLEPIIVYFPDSSQWLSRAVMKSNYKQFIQKLEEMFDQLTVPVVLIYGQNKLQTSPREKGKLVVLPQFGRISRLPLPLHRLVGAFRDNKTSKRDNMSKVFPNILFMDPPKEEAELKAFHKQLEEDKKIIIARCNLVELHKVLHKHQLSCLELLYVNTDGVILTKQNARQVVGWARNHYLSSCSFPSIIDDRLTLPRDSLETAISWLKEQEPVARKPSQNLKAIAKDDYEKNFVSAVVPPGEIQVKFEDIGALEDVKRTLNELVTLPMRRPELFSRGNLLRPCKGILLFGPPGTGKTLLGKALATEAGANFISVTGSTLTSKWFGDAEKLTKALFSFASKLAPVIIFVDEVDSLLGARGGAFEHEATRRMRNEFMAAWDGLRTKDSQRIVVLGATNRPFDLDDAVIRRLPRRIYVDLPDAENRMKILKIFLAREALDSSFRYEEVANATEGYSGSDLKNLCIAAAYKPVREHLEEEKKGDGKSTESSLRPLIIDDFIQAKSMVGASVAYDAASMNELRKWNERYGEGGSRKLSPFGFGS